MMGTRRCRRANDWCHPSSFAAYPSIQTGIGVLAGVFLLPQQRSLNPGRDLIYYVPTGRIQLGCACVWFGYDDDLWLVCQSLKAKCSMQCVASRRISTA